ncbi:hypothetical protein LLG90_27190, partial [Aromatoleum toluclasticum]|uniref:hypothetical protein n=1 Tax=Aromatoleum toluclasticum TaxID=92003 RepID=UPI001D17DBAE
MRSGADDDTGTFPDFLQVTALDTLEQALVDDLPGTTPLDAEPAIKLIGARNQLDCRGETV